MEKVVLNSQKRDAGECVKTLRASKNVPAIVYGRKQEALALKIASSDMLRAYRIAGENHVVELTVDGKKMDVLFHEVQKAPVSGEIIHVDFYSIIKGEKVHTHIPLIFIGTSKAKTEEAAIVEELMKQIEVKCMPSDLIESIEVDIGLLEKTGDNIKVSDLKISPKIEIIDALDEVIAIATKAKPEKIEEEVVAEVPVEEETKTEE